MTEGYSNIALYENQAIAEAKEEFNRVTSDYPNMQIKETKRELAKVFYRDCFAGVEYVFRPSAYADYLIRVFVILPGYSGYNSESYATTVFRAIPQGAKAVLP